MNKIKRHIAVSLLTIMSLQSAAPLVAAVLETRVPTGTLIRLRASSTISGDKVSVGNTVTFSVTNDVIVDGKVVVRAGAIATGQVNTAKKPGILGAPGVIGVQLSSVQAVDGTEIPISANSVSEGENKQITSIIIGLLCILGFFMKGGDGQLQAGSMIEARTIAEANVNA